jgi:hypothetical protein
MLRISPNPKPMEDLSDQLKDRVRTLESQSEALAKEQEQVRIELDLVRQLLDIEMRRTGQVGPTAPRRTIGAIVNDLLLPAGPVHPKFMQETAEREGHLAPARAINAILQGYVRHGIATRVSDGCYHITPKGKETLSWKAEGSS